jgi:hypothetical protein
MPICCQICCQSRFQGAQCVSDDGPHVLGHGAVLAGRTMRIELERDADVRVPDAVADDLGILCQVQGHGGVGVAHVVEAYARHACPIHQAIEPGSDGVRVQRTSLGADHEVVVVGVKPVQDGADKWSPLRPGNEQVLQPQLRALRGALHRDDLLRKAR